MVTTKPNDDAPKGGAKTTLAPGTQTRMKERAEQEAIDFKRADELAFKRATEGVYDAELLDAVLALGGDATRSSPVREQILPDAEPGFTTTTGAYRCPIDPTTAAVPASEDSDIARNLRGTPTIGSREHGVPEQRYMGLEPAIADRLNKLPAREAPAKEPAAKNEAAHH
jgi:hypothetical protein